MYRVLNRDNLTIPIPIEISQKHENFSQFFSAFFKIYIKISNILKKRMTLSAFMFPILRTPKMSLDKCLKSPVSDKQHGKRAQALLKSASQYLYHIP